jgi:glucan endo-1,3-alpha-glucosidase
MWRPILSAFFIALLCLLSSPQTLVRAQSASPRLVFAHYMLITRPPGNDYSNDIVTAAGAGIDAFALNYGGFNVDWTIQEVYLADFNVAATQGNEIFVFLSFDTTSSPNNLTAQMCIDLANQYANHPTQLQIDDQMMLSVSLFIKAYKAGEATLPAVDPSEEDVFMFYRLHMRVEGRR